MKYKQDTDAIYKAFRQAIFLAIIRHEIRFGKKEIIIVKKSKKGAVNYEF